MIDIEKLKQQLNNANSFVEYEGAIVYNSNLINFNGDEQETFPISIKKQDELFVLTDLGITFNNLEKQDITLNDADVLTYVQNVIYDLQVGINNNQELYVFANSEQDCVYAIGRLYQAIILINYIPMQYINKEE